MSGQGSSAFPVAADHRQHLVVDEPPHATQHLQFVLGELLAQEEVVGGQRVAEIFEQWGDIQRLHQISPFSGGQSVA